MNDSGSAVGPARGELGLPLDHVIAIHDEIDLPFGEIRSKLGGGVAGHNGLKSLDHGLGGRDFWRVRCGVGRPNSTDPEIVSGYVLSRFREPKEEVQLLIVDAADETGRLVEQLAEADGPAEEGPA
jgi:peptidyl-tRNA hydrolase, PTH1 family